MESTTLFTAALGLKEPWNIRFRPLKDMKVFTTS